MFSFYCIWISICQHIMSGTCSKSVHGEFLPRDAMIVRIQSLRMVIWKSIFHEPFLLLMRNCIFIYFCNRLSQVNLIWSDVFCFLWWILHIINCLPLFLHRKGLESEYAYHTVKSRIQAHDLHTFLSRGLYWRVFILSLLIFYRLRKVTRFKSLHKIKIIRHYSRT